MHRLVGSLLVLAVLMGGCAAGTTEDPKKDASRSEEKKQPSGYGNY